MSESDLLIVVIASLIGSFVKSVTGMGFPLIAIPMLTFVIGVEAAVIVIAFPNAVANLLLNLGVRAERHKTRDLPMLAATSVVGAIVGTSVLVSAPERPLLIGLALTIFVFVVQSLRRPALRLELETTRRWAPLVGVLAGFCQGAVGASGPIVALWLHGYRLPKDAYVYSVTALFLVAGVAQLAVLGFSGQLDRRLLLASGLALVSTLAMVPVGTRMRDRIGGATFERLILVLLTASGCSLLVRGLG